MEKRYSVIFENTPINNRMYPSVKNVLRAPIFLNFRNFGTKRDTTKKLK